MAKTAAATKDKLALTWVLRLRPISFTLDKFTVKNSPKTPMPKITNSSPHQVVLLKISMPKIPMAAKAMPATRTDKL